MQCTSKTCYIQNGLEHIPDFKTVDVVWIERALVDLIFCRLWHFPTNCKYCSSFADHQNNTLLDLIQKSVFACFSELYKLETAQTPVDNLSVVFEERTAGKWKSPFGDNLKPFRKTIANKRCTAG